MQVPDYYTGFTQEEVEEMLRVFKPELKKCIAQYASNGDSVTRIRRDELRLEVLGCQRALKKFDPDTYGKRHRTMTSRVDGHIPR
jgi:hypothetical protein